jgi:hypothetical protein
MVTCSVNSCHHPLVAWDDSSQPLCGDWLVGLTSNTLLTAALSKDPTHMSLIALPTLPASQKPATVPVAAQSWHSSQTSRPLQMKALHFFKTKGTVYPQWGGVKPCKMESSTTPPWKHQDPQTEGCLRNNNSYLHYQPTRDFLGHVLEEEKQKLLVK